MASAGGAIKKNNSGRISRPPVRFGFVEAPDFQFEEVEDIRRSTLCTNHKNSKDLQSLNAFEKELVEQERLQRRDLSPESPGSNLLTWDMKPLNSTENFGDSHGIGESDNIGNQSRPLDRPDDHSAVGSELVSENPNLPSSGEKFSEYSLGSMPREDSEVTSPGGGGPVFFMKYIVNYKLMLIITNPFLKL